MVIQGNQLLGFTQNAGLASVRIERNVSIHRTLVLNFSVTIRQHPTTTATLEKRPRWRNQEYRQAYMEAAIEQGVAWQIKINRERRQLSQKALAQRIGTRQSAISRAEDPEYGRHRLETLAKIANAFDCALQVRFIPYSVLAMDSDDLSPDALYAPSFEEECSHEEHSREIGRLSSQRNLPRLSDTASKS
jgi:transcriptional regulator with XRE-family HTH domain